MTGLVMVTKGYVCGGGSGGKGGAKGVKTCEEEQQNQISVLALLLAALRKSMVSCRVDRQDDVMPSTTVHHMEIGCPNNVRHVTHVTFDRFNGFWGLPVEFQVEIPSRVPSASASVFGVSAESMQCSFGSNGNSVPTILLLMQERLYSQGGLKAEGVFRINPENDQEEHVRDQLNKGIVPNNIDVHCLAGLIKAWFRELPSGVLDGLSPEKVLKCNTEEESVDLVKQLKPTEDALLDWAVGLMADVVEEEESNKMNARNIAMVFAPNMTRLWRHYFPRNCKNLMMC
ncbi:rho GTPase-activating protein 2-like [Hibiscus syriacus]|uniref:rho GTPase-activating protein 2-like n=1 Tax=Hibiscus syriacus TaxID=106335 RepID=UPI0019214192|nr:rho GTPase-activating protein 2-like [Hibiscus syriacus]